MTNPVKTVQNHITRNRGKYEMVGAAVITAGAAHVGYRSRQWVEFVTDIVDEANQPAT